MSDTQLLEPELTDETPNATAGPVCPNCGNGIDDSKVAVCRHCGFYPSMGTFVELDPWDRADAQTVAEEPEEMSHLQVWMNLLPKWAWVLIGCHISVVVVSVMVRLTAPAEGLFRTAWSVSQLFIGFAVFMVCHALAYLAAIELDADYTLLDFLLRPFKIWTPVVRRLPRSLSQLAIGTCGVNASLMSILVIGGLPYHVLLDWGIKEPPKKELVNAIVARAKEVDRENGELEDAIEDFAGRDELDPHVAAAAEEQRATIDCLVVGYTLKPDKEEIASLVLAREYQGALVVVGRAAATADDEEGISYLERFRKIARRTPFVPTTMTAHWIDPVYTCRASYRSEAPNGKLRDIRFEKMLGWLNMN